MRFVKRFTVAMLAAIGAVQVVRQVVGATALALVAFGKWEPAAAAEAAPRLAFSAVSGLSLSLYGMYKDNQRYTRQSYGRIERNRARNDETRKAG